MVWSVWDTQHVRADISVELISCSAQLYRLNPSDWSPDLPFLNSWYPHVQFVEHKASPDCFFQSENQPKEQNQNLNYYCKDVIILLNILFTEYIRLFKISLTVWQTYVL